MAKRLRVVSPKKMTVETRVKLQKLVKYLRYNLKVEGSDKPCEMSLRAIAGLTGQSEYSIQKILSESVERQESGSGKPEKWDSR